MSHYFLNDLGYTSTRNSQSENYIENYLKINNIKYKLHYNFEWLLTTNNTKMFVDFYLPTLQIVIEYDGEQHYKFVEYFHKTVEKFEECKERDFLKEKLLNEHNIKVYRIIYSDNILSKLQEILD